MTIETIKVYKGASVVLINKCDLAEWNKNGYKSSSQQKAKKDSNKE